MSSNVNFLKATSELIQSSPEIKSFIYQQILEFDPFVTPQTLILVIARDPSVNEVELDGRNLDSEKKLHRIAIVLKEDESTIEAEALHENIYEAIKLAKEKLVTELVEIQSEIEGPNDRLKAIQQAGTPHQIH
jgi:ribosome-associated translation inhibitor RaiA